MEAPAFIGRKIRQIENAISQQVNRNFASLDLTCSQAFVLRYLATHQDKIVYPKDLERQFKFSHPTVSGLLQRMESKGFLACTPDPTDRRCKRIELTDKALQCHTSMVSRMQTMEQALLHGFSSEETSQLQSSLDRLLTNLTSMDQGGTQHD